LTAGDGTDTFSWTAPASNGRDISKYGFQISSDNGSTWRSTVNGTLNGETEVLTNSATIATQYKESSYKIRVRAYNEGGWGDYSDISTSGTVAWYKGNDNANSYTSQTVSETQACSNVSCGDCGTQAQQKTRSKEQRKYRFIRTGSTSGPYDATWSDYTSYPDWSTISCANTGSCVEDGSWSNTTNATQTIGGYGYTAFTQYNTSNVYVYKNITPQGCQDYGCGPPFTGSICSCWEYLAYQVQVCSTSGAKRAVEVGCKQFRNTDCGGAGS
jgi:hypothetical protein